MNNWSYSGGIQMATLATEILMHSKVQKLSPSKALFMPEMLVRAGRLDLAPDVVLALDDFPQAPEVIMSAVMAGAIRLPLIPMWVEWDWFNPEDRTEQMRIGCMVMQNDRKQLVVSTAVRFQSVCSIIPAFLVINDKGAQAHHLTDYMGEELDDLFHYTIYMVLRTLLMLSAKNAPLKMGEADDYERLNRQRAKAGKPPVLGCRPVKWDLSRIERRVVGGLTPEGRKKAIAHVVRGHIKIKKNGSFWWNPFFRCVKDGGELPNGRDYKVINGN
jgi:hypothetical protein